MSRTISDSRAAEKLLDPEEPATYHDLTDEEREEIREEHALEWMAAREHRKERELRATQDYLLYKRDETEAEAARVDRQGWSKLRSPLVYWTVETLVPRVAVIPPTITVTPLTGDAVPYAAAKQMRLQHYLRMGRWHRRLLRTVKQMFVVGDSPVKVPYLRKHERPDFEHISWWDFFISPEADDYESADILWHRALYTERQLRMMARQTDSDGRPLWQNLEDVAGVKRSEVDETFAERKEASGGEGEEHEPLVYPVIEGWAADGSYITLGGSDGEHLLRCQRSPYGDRKGHPIRPFVMFQNTPDLVGPYSLSLGQLLEDHQIELETLRNAWIDQINGNIHAPIAHMDDIPDEEVEAAFSTPNGRIRVPSDRYNDVRQAIMRMPPGQVSSDFMAANENVRSEAQMAAGVSDISSGQVSAEGLSNQTATGMSIIAGEVNKRVQLVMLQAELAMAQVARIYDAHDAKFGGYMTVPVRSDTPIEEGTPGIEPVSGASGRVARISPELDGDKMDYFIEVDAGSLARPDQMEETQKLIGFLGMVGQNPMIGAYFDYARLSRKLAVTMGMSDDVLVSQEEAEARLNPPPPPGPEGPPPAPPEGAPA